MCYIFIYVSSVLKLLPAWYDEVKCSHYEVFAVKMLTFKWLDKIIGYIIDWMKVWVYWMSEFIFTSL